jgi:Obg family GTPase CgtA-like protein
MKLVAENKSRPGEADSHVIPVIGLKDDDNSWRIEKSGDNTFVVTGRKIESFAGRTKFGDRFGEQRLRDIMNKMGIMRELEKKGIQPGQKIHFGDSANAELKY